MPFLNRPLSRQLKKRRFWSKQYWELTEDLFYKDSLGKVHIVPAGFKHDFASIPRILWPILSPTGPYSYAAVLHDFTDDDRLFYEAMLEDGTPAWLAKIMYLAVVPEAPGPDFRPPWETNKTIND